MTETHGDSTFDRRRNDVQVALLVQQVDGLAQLIEKNEKRQEERADHTDTMIDGLDVKVDNLKFLAPEVYAADKYAAAELIKTREMEWERRIGELEKFKTNVYNMGLAVLLGGGVMGATVTKLVSK